jgi:hypothetical protein
VFEMRLGTRFEEVRIHNDWSAGRMAQDLRARAFTRGRDIYFAPGHYQPTSPAGQGLLAHELTHVVQQRNGRFSPSNSDRIAYTRSRLEAEAEQVEHAVQTSTAPVQVRAKALETEIYCSPGDKDLGNVDLSVAREEQGWLAGLKARVSGSIEAVADWVMGKVEAATDATLCELNALRRQLRGVSEILVPAEVAARFEEIYQQFRTDVPSWIPVPEIKFGGGQTQQAGPLVIPIAAVILLIAFLIVILWYLGNLNPATRKAREQAAQEVVEKIKEALKRKPAPEPKPEKTGPTIGPGPVEEEKPDANAMRFQVQWGTNEGGPTFSQVSVGPRDPGVTTNQAVEAVNAVVSTVVPKAARQAAEPAAAKQIRWILARPPQGIGPERISHSEYFEYSRYTDARVDVENLRGRNLRV